MNLESNMLSETSVREKQTLSISLTAVLSYFSHGQHFVIPQTVACQAPLSMDILQARTLQWVALPSSRGSSSPRDGIQASCVSSIGRWVHYSISTTWEAPLSLICVMKVKKTHIGTE